MSPRCLHADELKRKIVLLELLCDDERIGCGQQGHEALNVRDPPTLRRQIGWRHRPFWSKAAGTRSRHRARQRASPEQFISQRRMALNSRI